MVARSRPRMRRFGIQRIWRPSWFGSLGRKNLGTGQWRFESFKARHARRNWALLGGKDLYFLITAVRLRVEQFHLVRISGIVLLLEGIANHLNNGPFLKNVDLQNL